MRTIARLIALLSTIGVATSSEQRGGWDHYIQVDVGEKNYDILLYRHDNERLRGTFTESIVVTPTACIRGMDRDLNFGFLLTAGVAYGHFRDERIEADTLEFHVGVGGTARLTDWAHLNLMVSAGSGWTGIDLPPGYRTWDDHGTASGGSGHIEAVAGFGIDLWGALLTLNGGYRYTGMVLSDEEDADRVDDYAIHGFVVGAGLGFTF